MLRRSLSVAGLAALADLSSVAAETDTTLCYPRVELLRLIEQEYFMKRIGYGIGAPTSVTEVWWSERTGDWMIIRADANGRACVVSSGQDWQMTLPQGD